MKKRKNSNLRYRAWDKFDKRYMYKTFFDRNWYASDYPTKETCGTIRSLMPDDLNRVELDRFTGVKDRNKFNIYENDIVVYRFYSKYSSGGELYDSVIRVFGVVVITLRGVQIRKLYVKAEDSEEEQQIYRPFRTAKYIDIRKSEERCLILGNIREDKNIMEYYKALEKVQKKIEEKQTAEDQRKLLANIY